jgi:hypothetical protein
LKDECGRSGDSRRRDQERPRHQSLWSRRSGRSGPLRRRIGGGVFFFWRDFNQTLTRLNEAPIAEVTWKQKNAQRRFADRVLWDRLRMTSPVYDEDLVRTAELSEAVIAFTESPYLIVVHENTLLHITAPQKDTDPDGPLDREAPVRIYEGSAELWREGESVILDAAAAGASLPHASGVSYHHGPCHRPKRLHLHPGRIPSFL